MLDTQRLDLQLNETTLYDLKRKLFCTWLYADTGYIIEDETIPSASFKVLRRIKSGLDAISIMDENDHNRELVWNVVSQFLNHLIGAGWTLRTGDDQGVLCVRIVDPLAADQGYDVNVVVPHEGRRQLRALEGWCSSLVSMN